MGQEIETLIEKSKTIWKWSETDWNYSLLLKIIKKANLKVWSRLVQKIKILISKIFKNQNFKTKNKYPIKKKVFLLTHSYWVHQITCQIWQLKRSKRLLLMQKTGSVKSWTMNQTIAYQQFFFIYFYRFTFKLKKSSFRGYPSFVPENQQKVVWTMKSGNWYFSLQRLGLVVYLIFGSVNKSFLFIHRISGPISSIKLIQLTFWRTCFCCWVRDRHKKVDKSTVSPNLSRAKLIVQWAKAYVKINQQYPAQVDQSMFFYFLSVYVETGVYMADRRTKHVW